MSDVYTPNTTLNTTPMHNTELDPIETAELQKEIDRRKNLEHSRKVAKEKAERQEAQRVYDLPENVEKRERERLDQIQCARAQMFVETLKKTRAAHKDKTVNPYTEGVWEIMTHGDRISGDGCERRLGFVDAALKQAVAYVIDNYEEFRAFGGYLRRIDIAKIKLV